MDGLVDLRSLSFAQNDAILSYATILVHHRESIWRLRTVRYSHKRKAWISETSKNVQHDNGLDVVHRPITTPFSFAYFIEVSHRYRNASSRITTILYGENMSGHMGNIQPDVRERG